MYMLVYVSVAAVVVNGSNSCYIYSKDRKFPTYNSKKHVMYGIEMNLRMAQNSIIRAGGVPFLLNYLQRKKMGVNVCDTFGLSAK
jgi:hypothetical protein